MSKLASPPFATLEWSSDVRPQALASLLERTIEGGLLVVVGRTRWSLFGVRASKLLFAKGNRFKLYNIASESDLDEGVRLLVNLRPWHKLTFRIWIGTSDTVANIQRELLVDQNLSIDALEHHIESTIVGFIDPVDESLECYGEEQFRQVVSSIAVR